MDKNGQGRGGARTANPDYKKVRKDVFNMVEQLVSSNTILTASLNHNELLQRKAHLTRNKLREEVSELTEIVTSQREEIDCQNEIIEAFEQEKKDWLGAKEYRNSKKEIN